MGREVSGQVREGAREKMGTRRRQKRLMEASE